MAAHLSLQPALCRVGPEMCPLYVRQTTGPADEGMHLTAFRVARDCYISLTAGQAASTPHQNRSPGEASTPVESRTVVEAAVTLPSNWEETQHWEEANANPALTAALDSALDAIRSLQHMTFQLTRVPMEVPTAETLPAIVPLLLTRRVTSGVQLLEGGVRAFINNLGEDANHLRLDGFEESPREVFGSVRGPFTSYLSLRNEADVSLRLHGRYRAALILYAAACESLLDTTIQLLLWEGGRTPEEAVAWFLPPRGLESRVRATLPQLIGGHWDGRAGSAMDVWIFNVLHPRNISIHSGLGVTRQVAWDAMTAVDSLRMYLVGKVFNRKRRYPITSLALSADLLMVPESGSLESALQAATSGDSQQLPRFQRWRQCLASIVADRSDRRMPTRTSGGLLAVVLSDNQVTWVWHDWASRMAQVVTVAPEDKASLSIQLAAHSSEFGGWIGFAVKQFDAVVPVTDWLEDHNLIPGLQCLIKADDLDRALNSSATSR
jgi:hypothetical protein